jgi:type VI secretion system protein ImpF
MATQKFERTIQQGVLDRLIDYEPDNRSEAPMTRAESLRQFRAAVRRDLEFLLNTVRPPIPVPESCKEVPKSLLFYGLPDVSSVTLASPGDEQRLLRSLESTIAMFEPRLARVKVSAKERLQKGKQSITFHVEAMLLVDPAPERIAFDTVLEITKGAYSVKED